MKTLDLTGALRAHGAGRTEVSRAEQPNTRERVAGSLCITLHNPGQYPFKGSLLGDVEQNPLRHFEMSLLNLHSASLNGFPSCSNGFTL
jgi:hypothetical protein